jgi:hypothetical protein
MTSRTEIIVDDPATSSFTFKQITLSNVRGKIGGASTGSTHRTTSAASSEILRENSNVFPS